MDDSKLKASSEESSASVGDLFSEYQSVSRRVSAISLDKPNGSYIAPHKHSRNQILYASSGLMKATTEDAVWFIPPQRALWIPAGVIHDQTMLSYSKIRTIYIDQSIDLNLGSKCKVIEVDPLLRELIMALAEQPLEYELTARNHYLVELLLAEIRRGILVPIELPWPKDKRIVSICESVIKEPNAKLTLEYWANTVGASQRTLIRLFLKETGLSYRQWVQQAALAYALTNLESGSSVMQVSMDLGFSSSSAFTVMFKRMLGETPQSYIARSI